MSLDKSFYMDEELGLDLKQPITKVDLTSIDLCLLSLEEKEKSELMDREVDLTINGKTSQTNDESGSMILMPTFGSQSL